jgi:hypothetical protein
MDVVGIADPALDGFHVFGVHRAVTRKGMDRPPQPDPETHRVGSVANPDLFLEAGRQIHQRHGTVEHDVDGFAKAGFNHLGGGLVHSLSPLGPGSGPALQRLLPPVSAP